MKPYDHALICLLWSETDTNGAPLDTLGVPISDSLRTLVRRDWERFREDAETLGFNAEVHCARMLHPDNEGDAWNAAAHDFILTRNHHGTGFWEPGRWCAPWDRKLTKLAHSFGSLCAYVGNDGMIYGESGG